MTMSEPIAIEFDNVGKMYRLYKNRLDSFLDITSLGRVAPWWKPKIENFWALRNVDFKLKAGSRLGILGRNGAGKTTLLKLITGNVMPTEGRIKVNGEVQALLEAGAGFHPEFTGYENVEASLIQNGLSHAQIKAAIEEIAEFTELGDFLSQPFKTYSAGMQARLVFTTATTIKPDILIVDEILGAGDAYFAGKSRSRMKGLVESGASVLLVSHSLDQILQFCEEAIWVERGRILMRGPSLEVVKAYTEFIHTLQDRQLKSTNRRRTLGFRDVVEVGHFTEAFVVAIFLTGEHAVRAGISEVELRCGNVAEETLRIGDPQDSDQTHSAHVVMSTSTWGEPEAEDGELFRSLSAASGGGAAAIGQMVFRTYTLESGKTYSFRIRYRMLSVGRLAATVWRNGQAIIINVPLSGETTEWQESEIPLPLDLIGDSKEATGAPIEDVPIDGTSIELADGRIATMDAVERDTEMDRGDKTGNADAMGRNMEVPPGGGQNAILVDGKADVTVSMGTGSKTMAVEGSEAANSGSSDSKMAVRRWPGEGTLLLDNVVLQDSDGSERAVYRVGSDITFCLHYRATKKGSFPVIFTVAIYTVDGTKVSQHVSSSEMVHMDAGERRSVRLEFPSVDLADGRYVISVALHRDLDPRIPNETVRYDLLAYSFQFDIVGNPPLRTSLFVLPAVWRF